MASKHQQQKAHVNDKDSNDDKGNINDNNKRKKPLQMLEVSNTLHLTLHPPSSSNETKSKNPSSTRDRVADS